MPNCTGSDRTVQNTDIEAAAAHLGISIDRVVEALSRPQGSITDTFAKVLREARPNDLITLWSRRAHESMVIADAIIRRTCCHHPLYQVASR